MRHLYELAKQHHKLEKQITEQIASISAAVHQHPSIKNIELDNYTDLGYLQKVNEGLESCDMTVYVGDNSAHVEYTYTTPYDGTEDVYSYCIPSRWSEMSDDEIVEEIVSEAILEHEQEAARELAELENLAAKHGFALRKDNE